ncbi:MAG: ATP-grasp domain-containing protein [Polyangiaceae bacterium]|jgi:biotin carboxylase|nr:ATP-grasp domain-containing protein [Polyangiaceae bacterium]
MTPWLAFVESNTSGTGWLFAQAARRLGLRPVLLAEDGGERYPYVRSQGVEVRAVATREVAAVVEACEQLREGGGLAGVTTTSDYFVEVAADTARRLGLPGPEPGAVAACRDKHAQRVALRDAGAGVPRFVAVESASEAEAAAEALGPPVVVKPVSGSGSVGVRLCATAREAAEHAAGLLSRRVNERGMPVPARALVESFERGPEFSAESIGGRVVGVVAKHVSPPPYFVETGHDFPAALSPQALGAIEGEATRALSALRLGWGPAHTEIRLTERGPVIMEVNPRLAGGFIPELVRLARGVDLVTQCVRLAAGRPIDLESRSAGAASIRFLLAEGAGVLTAFEGLEAAGGGEGVVEAQAYAEPPRRVAPGGDFRDRLGHVIAVGPTAALAAARAEAARGAVRLRVEAGEPAGGRS